jgi:hypothetical protein
LEVLNTSKAIEDSNLLNPLIDFNDIQIRKGEMLSPKVTQSANKDMEIEKATIRIVMVGSC